MVYVRPPEQKIRGGRREEILLKNFPTKVFDSGSSQTESGPNGPGTPAHDPLTTPREAQQAPRDISACEPDQEAGPCSRVPVPRRISA